MARSKSHITSLDDRIVDTLVYVLGTLITVIAAYPLIFVLSASFSEPSSVITGKVVLWPVNFTVEGYKTILEYAGIWTGYRNTIFYTLIGTTINICLTLPAAYALSRADFKARGFFTAFFSFTMFFNGGLIPTYLVVKDLGLVNNPAVLVILGAVSVWNMMITRTFFQGSIPHSLEEAAYLDGCSTTRLFLQIVLPLSTPIIAVLVLFYAVGHWNNYFNALIYLSKAEHYPLQLYLRNVLILEDVSALMGDTEAVQEWLERLERKEAMKFGVVVVSSVPVLVLYPFLQKYFVKGMTIGAIKG